MANTADNTRWHQGIGSRIGLGFSALLLIAVLSFAAAVWLGLKGQSDTEGAVRGMAERVAAVQAMQVAQLEAVASVRNAALMSNARAVKAEMQVYQGAIQRLRELEDGFSSRALDDESRRLLANSVTLRKSAEPVVAEAIDQVLALAGEEGARILSARLTPVQTQWMEQLRLLSSREAELAAAEVAAIDRRNRQRMAMLAAGLLVSVVLAGCGAVWFTRTVTRRLRRAVTVTERVADGDLSILIDIQGDDETAVLLRRLRDMVVQLSTMVTAVRGSAASVASSSRDIDARNQDLAARTEQQAAALQQTSASIAMLAAALTESSSHVESARSLAGQAADAAGAAGQAAQTVVGTMAKIRDSSGRIADIIGVIDGIAFQTNILALNAAVEAARAGEQGRGFAVVAGEVRALAQRVAQAAGEVKKLIDESVVRVKDGSEQVADMGSTMGRLLSSTDQVKTLLDAIASTASAQRSSIGELNSAMQEVDSATQQNAALVEHVAAAASGLVEQTESLDVCVGRFQVPEQA